MVVRAAALALLLGVPAVTPGQEVVPPADELLQPSPSAEAAPQSAWLDLRQTEANHSKTQPVPSWIEALNFVPASKEPGKSDKSVFRIRLKRPSDDCQILLFRVFFDDKPKQQPELVAWDESGTQILRSGPLGEGTGLATSASTIVPMIGVSSIDLEVPGNGRTVRGAYLDWMKTAQVMRPVNSDETGQGSQPFGAPPPLKSSAQDSELFGTITAPLAPETIPIGSSVETGAGFRFGLESGPLTALLTFEIASPQIDSPPEIYVNGTDIGPASLTLPDLADPGYQGMSQALIEDMRFQYTGWVRAQKIVPASLLKAGANDVIVVAGPGTPASAVRETQIQLKYLWDKSDYLLQPLK